MENCDQIHESKVPRDSTVISSHVLHKVKVADTETLLCEARIAPDCNMDPERFHLKTDFVSCHPLGIRIFLSVCTLYSWLLSNIGIKSAFLQSGAATRDFYVIPSRECSKRLFCWLLEFSSCRLVNANAKWQLHFDSTFIDFGLLSVVYVPQFFI